MVGEVKEDFSIIIVYLICLPTDDAFVSFYEGKTGLLNLRLVRYEPNKPYLTGTN
jgi:hypothetical protein